MGKLALIPCLLLSASTTLADDRRIPIPPSDAHSHAIGLIRGETPSGTWVGGAVAIAETSCFVAVTTAGHNIIDGQGNPTAPLHKIHVELANTRLQVVSAHTDPIHNSTTPPEHDWAVAIAEKPGCGQPYATIAPKPLGYDGIPKRGMPVTMACIHHDTAKLRNQISAEQCRLYPPGQEFQGLYSHKQGEPVGLHSCTAHLGTSGCPLLTDRPGEQARFIGTQIEAHLTTGAGVARLFAGNYERAYQLALQEMQQLNGGTGQKTAQLSGSN